MYLLGIESSCDESSASIVKDGKEILSNVIFSQVQDHERFQGVVPEIASRLHLEKINGIIDEAFSQANLNFTDIDAVAVVYKPGLIGSLLVGLATAKSFAYCYDIPIIPVNHIEAHLYAPHIEHEIPFPNIGLVVSGGHTLIMLSKSHTNHEIIGSTVDDAVGECFDKVAKHYELGYPGGPVIDRLSKAGDDDAYRFPRAKFKKGNAFNFSYSGLKTAVIHQTEKFKVKNDSNSMEDLLASFQKSAMETLLEVCKEALNQYELKDIVISGGVACNSYLRETFTKEKDLNAFFPSPMLSTDNGAMVAGLGYHLYREGIVADLSLNAHSKIIKQGRPV